MCKAAARQVAGWIVLNLLKNMEKNKNPRLRDGKLRL